MLENVDKNKHESDKIWDEIKNLSIDMFALPNQTVQQHIVPLQVAGKELLVKLVSTAALPALEEAINRYGKKYTVTVAEGYVVVTRASTREDDIKKALGLINSK